MNSEKHPFCPYVPPHADKLILGSFPCLKDRGGNGDYGDWYYLASGKNYFWNLMIDVFKYPVKNRGQKEVAELKDLLKQHHIALTDIILRVNRLQNNCNDSNLQIKEYNTKEIQKIIGRGIKKIFFTSRYVERHFKREFKNTLSDWDLICLPSPSPRVINRLGYDHVLAQYQEALSP